MHARVCDLQGFDQRIEVPADCTVAELRSILKESHGFDSASCTFIHNREPLPETKVITPRDIEASDTIVIFNDRAFPERSFPATSHGIVIPASRFERNYISRNYGTPAMSVREDGPLEDFWEFDIFPGNFTAHDKAICSKIAETSRIRMEDAINFYNQAGHDLDVTIRLIVIALEPQ
jgi:hypothetical protein